jgi:hypothetical protein
LHLSAVPAVRRSRRRALTSYERSAGSALRPQAQDDRALASTVDRGASHGGRRCFTLMRRSRPECGIRAAAASSGGRPRQEAALDLADEPLELAHTLAERGVLGVKAGERRGRRLGARLSPAGDAAAWGANALRAAARQREPADLAQTGRVRRTYVSHRTRRRGDREWTRVLAPARSAGRPRRRREPSCRDDGSPSIRRDPVAAVPTRRRWWRRVA